MKFKFVIFASFILFAVACAQPQQSQQISISTTVLETAVPDIPTCYGWRLHLTSATKTDQGDGWTLLGGNLVWENVSAGQPSYDNNFTPLFQENVEAWRTLQVTTDQGYSYPLNPSVSSWLTRLYVPPGYMFPVPYFDMYIKVSSVSTGWKIATPCGVLDFAHPETDLQYPSWDGLPIVGSTVQFENGTITLDSFENCNYSKQGDLSDYLCPYFTITNTDMGYEHTTPFRMMMQGPGLQYAASEYDRLYIPIYSDNPLTVGPGQKLKVVGQGVSGVEAKGGVLLFLQIYSYEGTSEHIGQTWVFVLQPKP